MFFASAASHVAADRAVVRDLIEERGAAVVTLEAVFDVKVNYGGQQQEYERRAEEVGVVVDPSGLAITSLSSVDPGQFYARLYGEQDGGFTTQLKDLKYVMADGTEIAAGISLRDPDFDIAVLRPLAEPDSPLVHISLDDPADAEILEELYLISRHGRIARRVIHATTIEVNSIVDRPRYFYIPYEPKVAQRMGSIVVNGEGQPIGMTAYYLFPGGADSLGEEDEPFIAVIVPVDDILDVVEQARDIAPEAPVADPAPADADEDDEQEADSDELPMPDLEAAPLP